MGVGDVVDAGANAIEAVVASHHHIHHHLGVFPFRSGVGAVLAIAGDVEQRGTVMGQFLLELHGLAHQLLGAGVVVDHRQDGEGLLAGKEDFGGMAHGVVRLAKDEGGDQRAIISGQ